CLPERVDLVVKGDRSERIVRFGEFRIDDAVFVALSVRDIEKEIYLSVATAIGNENIARILKVHSRKPAPESLGPFQSVRRADLLNTAEHEIEQLFVFVHAAPSLFVGYCRKKSRILLR